MSSRRCPLMRWTLQPKAPLMGFAMEHPTLTQLWNQASHEAPPANEAIQQ